MGVLVGGISVFVLVGVAVRVLVEEKVNVGVAPQETTVPLMTLIGFQLSTAGVVA